MPGAWAAVQAGLSQAWGGPPSVSSVVKGLLQSSQLFVGPHLLV